MDGNEKTTHTTWCLKGDQGRRIGPVSVVGSSRLAGPGEQPLPERLGQSARWSDCCRTASRRLYHDRNTGCPSISLPFVGRGMDGYLSSWARDS